MLLCIPHFLFFGVVDPYFVEDTLTLKIKTSDRAGHRSVAGIIGKWRTIKKKGQNGRGKNHKNKYQMTKVSVGSRPKMS